MKPEMQRALVELSAFYHTDPTVVFRRIVETLAAQYPGAMAMINLVEGERLVFREVARPHPLVASGRVRSLRLTDTW